jgi:MFS superfamily sulfate permease-like transporter
MGAQTPLSSVITAVIICIFLLFLTPIFQYLPKLVLAVIVVLSVRSLIDYKEAQYLWKVRRVVACHRCHRFAVMCSFLKGCLV